MKRLSPTKLLFILSVLLPCCLVVAIAVGAVSIPLTDVIHALFYNEWFYNEWFSNQTSAHYRAIIVDIRLPRVLLTAFIGAILAISGAVMQGLFRNPLADPSLIGVTAGASLGASLVIVLGGSGVAHWLGVPLMSLGAFVGGGITVWLVYRLASYSGGTSVATMLLAGIGVAAFVGSITSLLEFYADNHMLRRISLWRMGSLEGATTWRVGFAAMTCLILVSVLPRYSQALNALLLGESEARHLGIDTEKLKRIIIIAVALGVGVAVSLAGAIGFVGLVVPHIVRLLIGPDHRFLLPASTLAGAILLVLADTLARIILAPTELPVGLVTAFIGVPFFLSLLTRRYVYGLH
jgi:iron complex transport system permease protein